MCRRRSGTTSSSSPPRTSSRARSTRALSHRTRMVSRRGGMGAQGSSHRTRMVSRRGGRGAGLQGGRAGREADRMPLACWRSRPMTRAWRAGMPYILPSRSNAHLHRAAACLPQNTFCQHLPALPCRADDASTPVTRQGIPIGKPQGDEGRRQEVMRLRSQHVQCQRLATHWHEVRLSRTIAADAVCLGAAWKF